MLDRGIIEDFFEDWAPLIDSTIISETLDVLSCEATRHRVYPKQSDIFKAFLECPFDNCTTVFVGQDPYPQKNIATGILFGNADTTPLEKYSPSLRVFLNSIDSYYDDIPSGKQSPSLLYLAHQGILMLNSALTVIENSIGSHSLLWRKFTASLLYNISTKNPNIIFVLFGNQAQSFFSYIKSDNIIECPHPAYCDRKDILLPDIFKEIDIKREELNLPYIYWK